MTAKNNGQLTAHCQCTQPGWCERHQCEKTPHWHRLCQSNAACFQLWEEGRGPGQHIEATVSEEALCPIPICPDEVTTMLAPLRNRHVHQKPWQGGYPEKPWSFSVAAAIPVLDTWEPLEVAVELLRLQSERPYIMVIDTGSSPENYARIEQMRGEDLEVHALRLNGVLHPSDFPAMAMDLSFTLCRSPFLFATHADCFLRNRKLLEEMLELCRTTSPVVGYELTPRAHKDWKGMVGHTCTMMEMETMDRIGAGWSLRRLATLFGIANHEPDPKRPNWPDTEVLLNYLVRKNGIRPHLIGHEENFERNRDDNIDHCRTLTGGLLYSPEHYAKAKRWTEDAMLEGRQRIARWRHLNGNGTAEVVEEITIANRLQSRT